MSNSISEISKERSRLKIYFEKGVKLEIYQSNVISFSDLNTFSVTVIQKDNKTLCIYDVSGFMTVKEYIERAKCTETEIRAIISGVARTIEYSEKYLLNKRCFLLDENYVFINEQGEVKLIYLPVDRDMISEDKYDNFIMRIMIFAGMDNRKIREILNSDGEISEEILKEKEEKTFALFRRKGLLIQMLVVTILIIAFFVFKNDNTEILPFAVVILLLILLFVIINKKGCKDKSKIK